MTNILGFCLILTLQIPLFVNVALSCVKENFVVAIDIGHTKEQPGAMSARGVVEFQFNKALAEFLLHELRAQGFSKAFLINEDGASISLADRAEFANKQKARLLLSIHHDSVQPQYLSSWVYKGKQLLYSDLFSGYSIFFSEKNGASKESYEFAQLLGSALRRNYFIPTLHHAEKIKGENRELVDRDRGIYRFDGLEILKTAKIPAVLLEAGIIVNRQEEVLLSNRVYQKMLTWSIGQAIEEFCEGNAELH